jgi:xylulokinase
MKFGATIDRTPKWHHQVFEIFDSVGLKPELLPQIVPPGTQIGHARSELADAMGLKSVMLYQGLTDGNASALAMGLNHPGDFGITCGSTSVVKFVAPRRKSHPSIYYHKHPLDGYLASAAFETGSVLKWFVSKLLGITLDEALNLADRIPAGTEWEYYPESNRSPFYDPSLGNSFLRIIQNAVSLNEVRGNFVRSLIVGLALHEYSYIPLFEDMFNVRIDKIRLLGGSAASDYGNETYQIWNCIRAAVWGRTILQMEPRTTAGVLIPAVLREGLYENIDEASKKLLRVRTIIEPDEEESDRYKPRRENFMKKWRLISKLQSFRHINFQDSIF